MTQGGTVNVGYGTVVAPLNNLTSCVTIYNGSNLILWDKLSFTGEGFRALVADGGSIFSTTGMSIDFEGFVAGHSLVHSSNAGKINLAAATLTGSAVGRPYMASALGQIVTLKGAEGIPGTLAGITQTGGQYV